MTRQQALTTVTDFITTENSKDNWVCNWSNHSQFKFQVAFNNYKNIFIVIPFGFNQEMTLLPYANERVANALIQTHQEELETLINTS